MLNGQKMQGPRIAKQVNLLLQQEQKEQEYVCPLKQLYTIKIGANHPFYSVRIGVSYLDILSVALQSLMGNMTLHGHIYAHVHHTQIHHTQIHHTLHTHTHRHTDTQTHTHTDTQTQTK